MKERGLLREAKMILYDDLRIDHMKKKMANLVLSGLKFFGLELESNLNQRVVQSYQVENTFQLFFSYLKDLVGEEDIIELKNDLAIRGTAHSIAQYLNIKLKNTKVVVQDKYPHLGFGFLGFVRLGLRFRGSMDLNCVALKILVIKSPPEFYGGRKHVKQLVTLLKFEDFTAISVGNFLEP